MKAISLYISCVFILACSLGRSQSCSVSITATDLGNNYFQLTANPVIPVGWNATYTWQPQNGVGAYGQTIYYQYPPSLNYAYVFMHAEDPNDSTQFCDVEGVTLAWAQSGSGPGQTNNCYTWGTQITSGGNGNFSFVPAAMATNYTSYDSIIYWYVDGIPADTGSVPFNYQFLTPGQHQVCIAIWHFDLVSGDTCISSTCDTLQVIATSAENNLNGKPAVQVYPNPAKDFFALKNLPSNALVSVFDISGRLVLSQKNVLSKTNFSTCELQNGIFFVEIISDTGERSFQKIVVER